MSKITLRKSSTVFKSITILIAISFLWMYVSPCVLAQTKVKIPAGTTVVLRYAETVSPATKTVGDSVILTVARDVEVDGKVVIKAGAMAKGEVVKSRTRNLIGIPAQISVSVRSVEAVDGTLVQLSDGKYLEGSSKMVPSIVLSLICCVLFALWKGGDVQIAQGAEITATTMAPFEIEVQ